VACSLLLNIKQTQNRTDSKEKKKKKKISAPAFHLSFELSFPRSLQKKQKGGPFAGQEKKRGKKVKEGRR
jgi:hypothetical protein